jgi:Anti-sigma-K factor rskA
MGRAMSRETTRPMSHEPFEEWPALAAIGALDDEERARFDAHLTAGCQRCEEELRDHLEVATTLPRALPDVPVPPSLRGRVMARAARDQQPSIAAPPPPPPRVTRRLRPLVGGLIAAGLAGLVVWGIYDTRSTVERQQASIEQLQQELAQQKALTSLVSNTDTSVAALRGIGLAERADGWVVWSPARKRGYLVVHHLPQLAPGKQYQLWVRAGAEPMSAGIFDVDTIGHAALVVTVDPEHPQAFAVTVERTGGARSPEGPVVMKGGGQTG